MMAETSVLRAAVVVAAAAVLEAVVGPFLAFGWISPKFVVIAVVFAVSGLRELQAVLLGTTWESYLGIELVNLGDRAEKDDFVVTSGRAGDKELLYPPGLLVGKVESSTATDIDQFKKIVVTPAVKPEELEEVRVIVGW